MKVKYVGMFVLVALLAVSLGGCGCFIQAQKGEAPRPKPPEQQVVAAPEATSSASACAACRHRHRRLQPPAPAAAMLQMINFDFDKYNVRPGDAEILKKNLDWFKANPGTKVRVEGNCDERGTVEYNLALGQKRADSAKNYLAGLGVDAKSARDDQLRQGKAVRPRPRRGSLGKEQECPVRTD